MFPLSHIPLLVSMAVRFANEAPFHREDDYKFTTQFIGVSSLGFNTTLHFHDSSELPANMDLFLDGANEYIETLRIWVGKSSIVGIEAVLTNDRTQSFGDTVRVHGEGHKTLAKKEFRFDLNEKVKSIEIYVNFCSRRRDQVTKREVHKTVDEEWRDACCCGLTFTTTKQRTFDVRPVSGLTFRTGYRVDVHSGNFNGIVAQTKMNSEGRLRIAALGFVFLEGSGGVRSVASFRHVSRSWWRNLTDWFKTYVQPKEFLTRRFPNFQTCWDSLRRSRRLHIVRAFLLQIFIPVFDVASDFWVASTYYRRGHLIVATIIMLFTFLPHVIYTIAYAIEGVFGSLEWSVYTEGVFGSIYNYECTGVWAVDVLIKTIVFPFHVLWVSLRFHLGLFRRAIEIIRLARSIHMTTDSFKHQAIREIRKNEWARSLILEFWFESIPQLLFQTTMFFILKMDDSDSQSLSLYLSLAASFIMTLHQAFIVVSFLKTTKLSKTNLLRLILSDYLSFFPIVSIFRDSTEDLELEDYDERLRDLWGALCQVLRVNQSLERCILTIKQKSDPWLINTMEVLEAFMDNTSIRLHLLEVRFLFEEPMDKAFCESFDHVFREIVSRGQAKRLDIVFLRQVDIYQEKINPDLSEEGEVTYGDLILKWKAPGPSAMKYSMVPTNIQVSVSQ